SGETATGYASRRATASCGRERRASSSSAASNAAVPTPSSSRTARGGHTGWSWTWCSSSPLRFPHRQQTRCSQRALVTPHERQVRSQEEAVGSSSVMRCIRHARRRPPGGSPQRRGRGVPRGCTPRRGAQLRGGARLMTEEHLRTLAQYADRIEVDADHPELWDVVNAVRWINDNVRDVGKCNLVVKFVQ